MALSLTGYAFDVTLALLIPLGRAPLTTTVMLKRGGFKFDDRKKEILAAVVRGHIATSQPVGSFALAQQSRRRVSSATIRNICAELEDEGLLTHPHTSAGRVPTDKGYRYYVDNLMDSKKLSRGEAARIEEELLREDCVSSPEA